MIEVIDRSESDHDCTEYLVPDTDPGCEEYSTCTECGASLCEETRGVIVPEA